MKSEHRHQLKTNELAEGIEHLVQWAKQNYKTLIYVGIITVLVIGSFFWQKRKGNLDAAAEQLELTKILTKIPQEKAGIISAKAKGEDRSIMLIQIADNLDNIAKNTDNNQMAAIAFIKEADLLRTELHYRSGNINKDDLTTQIERAKNSYNQAIEKNAENPSLTAAAKFGLGLCDEELGNFQQAKQTYNDIIENPGFNGTVAAHQAKQRLEIMDHFQKNLVFKVAKKTAPPEPVIKNVPLDVTDINLPTQ